MDLRFLTYVLKPWDELNLLLAKPYAFQPEISGITRLAGSLAVCIKHQAEITGPDRTTVDRESQDNQILSDVADAWKHGSLRNPARDNQLMIESQFEYLHDSLFRFVRNVVVINHASMGKFDFMATAREAIGYWIKKLSMPIAWTPAFAEGSPEFHNEAALYFNPKHQIHMDSVKIQIVSRNSTGELVPFDPPEVRFTVYEYNGSVT